jgi:hypothetical protein
MDTSNIKIHHTSGSGHALKDFYPLIAMAGLVLVLTYASVVWFALAPMLAFMGWFFLVFGALKLIRLSGFVEAYREYDLVAMRSRSYAYVYPFLEVGFGIAYLLAWQVVLVSVAVLVVMLVGAAGVYLKLRAKEEIPCACLGTVFKVPMTWVTLGEDLLMAGMASLLLL